MVYNVHELSIFLLIGKRRLGNVGSEYKESKDNPLHREYGIWSNTVYILKKMWEYKPCVIFLVILGIVCNSVLSYFWGIFGKYVIDIIQLGLSRQEDMSLLPIQKQTGKYWMTSA